MSKDKIEQLKIWYKENEVILDRLAYKLKVLIEEILDFEKIPYASVTSRKKDLDSLCNKANKPKYDNPIDQIKDFVGIRIVAYVESDVMKISDIIKDIFEIDNENSVDKSIDLGIDRVGYRSVHYVASFDDSRSKLQEYKSFKGLCFEIQIRTLLQHTWAEIEHDRNYKFSGNLPDEIKRKFSLIAGTLELLDNQFDSIANELDNYRDNIQSKTESGDIKNIKIDGTSLKTFLNNKFANKIGNDLTPSFGYNDSGEEDIINELNDFGITDLESLNDLISKHIDKDIYEEDDNFLGLLRTFMIVENCEKYFKYSWKEHWHGLSRCIVRKLSKLNKDIVKILNDRDIDISDF